MNGENMKEQRLDIKIQHPDSNLQVALVLDLAMLRFLCGDELVDPIKKRADEHNEGCSDCLEVLRENIKFY